MTVPVPPLSKGSSPGTPPPQYVGDEGGGVKRASGGGSTKQMICKVMLLDDSVVPFQVPHKSVGKILFDQICQSLNLLETDYFGVEYLDSEGNKCWLDNEKFIINQVGISGGDVIFKFCVKFYTPDPTQLEEEYTRYLFCLQLKRDLGDGSMSCSENTTALLASYIVQADCGDYSYEDYPDHTYLSGIQFVPKQTPNLEIAIMENHKKHGGQTPAEADLNFLDIARRVEMYGIKMHPAQDHEGVGLNLAVAHMGILVYQNMTRINTFSWAKIRKLSFKRKKFLIKLHPEEYGYYKDTVEFYFHTRNQSKNFWKKCIEHHTFFRVVNNFPISAEKPIVRHKRAKLFSKGSSFRYSGRTQKEIVAFVRESFINRQPFTRSMSSHLSIKSAASPNSHIKSGAYNKMPVEGADGSGLGQSLATPAGVPYYSINAANRSETRLSKTSSTSGSHLFDTSAEDVTHGLPSRKSIDQNVTNASSLPSHPLPTQSSLDGSVSLTQNDSTAPIISEIDELDTTDLLPVDRRKPSTTTAALNGHLLRRNVGDKRGGKYGRSVRSHSEWRDIPDTTERNLFYMNRGTASLNRRSDLHKSNGEGDDNGINGGAYGSDDNHLADLSLALDEYCGNDDSTFHRNGTLLSRKGCGGITTDEIVQSLFDILKELLMTEVTYCKDMALLTEELLKVLTRTEKLKNKPRFPSYNKSGSAAAYSNCGINFPIESHLNGLDPVINMTLTLNNILPHHKDLFRSHLEFKMAWWERIKKGRQVPLLSPNSKDPKGDASFYENFLLDVGDAFVLQNEVIELYRNYVAYVPLCLQWLLDESHTNIGNTDRAMTPNSNFNHDDWFLGGDGSEVEPRKSPINITSPLLEFSSYLNIQCLIVKPIYRIFYYHDIMTSLLEKAHLLDYHELVDPLYTGILSPLSGLKNVLTNKLVEMEDSKIRIDIQSNVFLKPLLHQYSTDLSKLSMLKAQATWGLFVRHGQLMYRKTHDSRSTSNKSRPILLILFERVIVLAERLEPTEDYKLTGLYETKFYFKSLFHNGKVELEYDLENDPVSDENLRVERFNDYAWDDQMKPCDFRLKYNSSTYTFTLRSWVDKFKWINDLQKYIGANDHYADDSPNTTQLRAPPCSPPIDKGDANYIISLGFNISWHRHLTLHKDDLMAANTNTMSGYLLRKYKNSAGWQKLWVVYANFYLFFYKDHDDQYPLANLPLPGYQISLPFVKECGQKDNVFRLHYKNHSYYFRTDTYYSFQRWMDTINATCERLYRYNENSP